jgi:hypothetical protein
VGVSVDFLEHMYYVVIGLSDDHSFLLLRPVDIIGKSLNRDMCISFRRHRKSV